MPQYLFLDKNTKKEKLVWMTITERTEYLKANPHIEQLVYGAPRFMDTVKLGRTKSAEGFKDLLKQIKKNNTGSTIET